MKGHYPRLSPYVCVWRLGVDTIDWCIRTFVDLESSMLHSKFQDHRASGSGEEDF